MASKITRWRPDTCGCVLDLSWDPAVPQDQRTHAVSAIQPCSEHTLTGPQAVGKVLEQDVVHPHKDNQRKNLTIGEALSRFTSLRDTQPDGSFTFKSGVSITWQWTGAEDARIITVGVVGATVSAAQRSQWQSAVDAKFGSGVVVIG